MGNCLSHIYEENAQKELMEKVNFVKMVAQEVSKINPLQNEWDYNDLEFLYRNREKILRNKKLIELLG